VTPIDPVLTEPLRDPRTVLAALDFAGVAVFAATGALAAAREKHDVITFAFFAAITGVGGGTLRDLLLGLPVFWVQDWRYMAVCLLAAVAIWLIGQRDWRFRALLWLDAIGLGAYGVMGAAKAEAAGAPPLICIVMGTLTACFGGVVRDTLAGQPSRDQCHGGYTGGDPLHRPAHSRGADLAGGHRGRHRGLHAARRRPALGLDPAWLSRTELSAFRRLFVMAASSNRA
jgi:hypothetical protein